MLFRTVKHVEIFNRSKGPYLFDKTYAYSLVLHGLTNRRIGDKKQHPPLNNRQQGEVFSLYRISSIEVILLEESLKQIY
jgi:hypothetical protein